MGDNEEILKLEREQLKFQKDNVSLFQNVVQGQDTAIGILTELKNNQGKQLIIMMVIVFLCGVVIGTQYKAWLPYMDEAIATVKSTNSVKGAL